MILMRITSSLLMISGVFGSQKAVVLDGTGQQAVTETGFALEAEMGLNGLSTNGALIPAGAEWTVLQMTQTFDPATDCAKDMGLVPGDKMIVEVPKGGRPSVDGRVHDNPGNQLLVNPWMDLGIGLKSDNMKHWPQNPANIPLKEKFKWAPGCEHNDKLDNTFIVGWSGVHAHRDYDPNAYKSTRIDPESGDPFYPDGRKVFKFEEAKKHDRVNHKTDVLKTVKDFEDMSTVCERVGLKPENAWLGIGLFDEYMGPDHCKNWKVTTARFKAKFNEICTQAGLFEDSKKVGKKRLIYYYSGHSVHDTGRNPDLMHQYHGKHNVSFRKTVVPILDKICGNGHDVVCILDTCYSGDGIALVAKMVKLGEVKHIKPLENMWMLAGANGSEEALAFLNGNLTEAICNELGERAGTEIDLVDVMETVISEADKRAARHVSQPQQQFKSFSNFKTRTIPGTRRDPTVTTITAADYPRNGNTFSFGTMSARFRKRKRGFTTECTNVGDKGEENDFRERKMYKRMKSALKPKDRHQMDATVQQFWDDAQVHLQANNRELRSRYYRECFENIVASALTEGWFVNNPERLRQEVRKHYDMVVSETGMKLTRDQRDAWNKALFEAVFKARETAELPLDKTDQQAMQDMHANPRKSGRSQEVLNDGYERDL